MVHRCPVLAANASAVPEVVEGNGLLLDPHDPAAWADAIIDLLHAPERQQALARASALGARRFTWHRATATLAAAYQHLAQARRIDPPSRPPSSPMSNGTRASVSVRRRQRQ
jgi:glycosyltransferase involved in cell wall biosynthesis